MPPGTSKLPAERDVNIVGSGNQKYATPTLERPSTLEQIFAQGAPFDPLQALYFAGSKAERQGAHNQLATDQAAYNAAQQSGPNLVDMLTAGSRFAEAVPGVGSILANMLLGQSGLASAYENVGLGTQAAGGLSDLGAGMRAAAEAGQPIAPLQQLMDTLFANVGSATPTGVQEALINAQNRGPRDKVIATQFVGPVQYRAESGTAQGANQLLSGVTGSPGVAAPITDQNAQPVVTPEQRFAEEQVKSQVLTQGFVETDRWVERDPNDPSGRNRIVIKVTDPSNAQRTIYLEPDSIEPRFE